ncbi:DUF4411 family protein [Oceanimonas sp. NS1]|nr:DUF4411 family protein [Oceanimonas sp. NS1]
MNYLLDANTFIEAKGRYYGMAICPGYWRWILHSNEKSEVASIDFVRDELLAGNDELKVWAQDNSHLFLPVHDEITQEMFGKVSSYVMSNVTLKPGAAEEFLSGADPWLIAKAYSMGATIVTHEHYNPDIKRKVLIPNVCQYFGIQCIDTFELLHRLDAEFNFAA